MAFPSASHRFRSRLLTVSLLGLAAAVSASDWAVNAKYFGLTYHPDGGENEGYPRQLDSKAYWVLEVGAQVDAERQILPWLSLRTSHSLYRDCADAWAGFDHIGFRTTWHATDRLALRIGIGPTFLWRQSWLGRVEGYHRDSFFGDVDSAADYQDAFLWYGGDVEASWMFNPRWGLVVSVIPGWPEVISTALGVRREF